MAFPLLGVLGAVFGPVVELGKLWFQERKTKAEGKIRIEEAKTEGEIKRIQTSLDGDIKYDVTAAEGMQHSWKDEWLTILVSIPVVMCFIPGGAKYVHDGFDALALTPDWFQYAFIGIIIASFGLSRFVMPLLQARLGVKPSTTEGETK